MLIYVEKFVIEVGLLMELDDYSKFLNEEFCDFFKWFSIVVGLIGNLGMLIGIMSVKLGFLVFVYMLVDVRVWKKNRFCVFGVNVIEYV